jgi:23S rRNA (uracil1939-C5)-methyltransferase
MNTFIKENEVIQIEIRKTGINGEGIGYYKKLAIFVDYALPNELVDVMITRVYDNRAMAKLVKIHKKSEFRATPFCPVYEQCGGCQFQHITYEQSLIEKRDMVLSSFDRYISFKVPRELVKETIGADDPKNYRNKASLPVQSKKRNEIGMYQANSHKFIAIDACPVQDKNINRILKTILDLMNTYKVDGFDPKYNKGYIKSLVVRVSEDTKEAQVSFILFNDSKFLDRMVKKLIVVEPMIKSVFKVLSKPNKKNPFFSDAPIKLYGKDTIQAKLDGYTFDLKPDAFFQLNTPQAHKFYLKMKELARLKKTEVAIDAYAGVAPVSHYIAKDCKHVYAVELDESSCISAKKSLNENGIDNVTVLHSDFNRALSGLKEKEIDVMLFDPPRTGLGAETIKLILESKPKRIVYGSCNPSTLAKDLNILLDHYYLEETSPLDMFPYTSLVESISLLSLKKA